jgi:hypothetical protein
VGTKIIIVYSLIRWKVQLTAKYVISNFTYIIGCKLICLQPPLCHCIVGPTKDIRLNKTSLMKRQFVLTHTFPKSDISALLDSLVSNTRSLKTLWLQTNCLSLHFRKNVTCLHVELLRICQVFCLLSNCVSVGYEKLLVLERYVHTYIHTSISLVSSVLSLFRS